MIDWIRETAGNRNTIIIVEDIRREVEHEILMSRTLQLEPLRVSGEQWLPPAEEKDLLRITSPYYI